MLIAYKQHSDSLMIAFMYHSPIKKRTLKRPMRFNVLFCLLPTSFSVLE